MTPTLAGISRFYKLCHLREVQRSQLVECKPFKLREDQIDSRERKSLKTGPLNSNGNATLRDENALVFQQLGAKFRDKNSSAPSQSKMFLQDLILDCEIFNLRASSMNVI
jgi:hypothetical protein